VSGNRHAIDLKSYCRTKEAQRLKAMHEDNFRGSQVMHRLTDSFARAQ